MKKNVKEAKIIECIFSLSVICYSPSKIKYFLEARGIKSVLGNNHWNVSTIKSILQNEKYKGDVLLQKSFTTDYKFKKRKKMRVKLINIILKIVMKRLLQMKFLKM